MLKLVMGVAGLSPRRSALPDPREPEQIPSANGGKHRTTNRPRVRISASKNKLLRNKRHFRELTFRSSGSGGPHFLQSRFPESPA